MGNDICDDPLLAVHDDGRHLTAHGPNKIGYQVQPLTRQGKLCCSGR
jgi:hypothetical protein